MARGELKVTGDVGEKLRRDLEVTGELVGRLRAEMKVTAKGGGDHLSLPLGTFVGAPGGGARAGWSGKVDS